MPSAKRPERSGSPRPTRKTSPRMLPRPSRRPAVSTVVRSRAWGLRAVERGPRWSPASGSTRGGSSSRRFARRAPGRSSGSAPRSPRRRGRTRRDPRRGRSRARGRRGRRGRAGRGRGKGERDGQHGPDHHAPKLVARSDGFFGAVDSSLARHPSRPWRRRPENGGRHDRRRRWGLGRGRRLPRPRLGLGKPRGGDRPVARIAPLPVQLETADGAGPILAAVAHVAAVGGPRAVRFRAAPPPASGRRSSCRPSSAGRW